MLHLYFVLSTLCPLLNLENTFNLRRKFWGKRSVKKLARWAARAANEQGIPTWDVSPFSCY